MHDRIDMLHRAPQQRRVPNVALHELHAVTGDRVPAAARLVVDDPDRPREAALGEHPDEVRAHEPAAAGNEDTHSGHRRGIQRARRRLVRRQIRISIHVAPRAARPVPGAWTQRQIRARIQVIPRATRAASEAWTMRPTT